MASSGKARTTMAKLQREATLRQRRIEKAVRKQIRKQTQSAPVQPAEPDLMASDSDADAPVPRSASDASPSPPTEP